MSLSRTGRSNETILTSYPMRDLPTPGRAAGVSPLMVGEWTMTQPGWIAGSRFDQEAHAPARQVPGSSRIRLARRKLTQLRSPDAQELTCARLSWSGPGGVAVKRCRFGLLRSCQSSSVAMKYPV